MRTASLDTIAVTFPELLDGSLFSIVALCILQAFWCETFEEIIDILVICSLALGLEAAGEEYLVDPVLFVMDDAIFEQRGVDMEAVIPFTTVPCIHTPGMEVK